MAATREDIFVINLENVVQERLDSFVDSRKKIRARIESEFQRRVSKEGLSYQAQLDYYQTQLGKEKEKFIPDQDYITEINDNIANLKKLVRYEKIRNIYNENYTQYKEGKISNDTLINIFKSQLETIDDPTLRTEINDKISDLRIAKVENDRKALENRITFAEKDRSIDLVNKMIAEVEGEKNDAYAVGDKELATFYEVKLQSLKSQKGKTMVEDKMQSIDFKATKDSLSSINKLNLLNEAITTADTTTPLIIDNKNYNSEAEYWQGKRNSYLAGSGDGIFKDFFNDLTTEAKNKIDVISAQSKFGYVSTSTLEALNSDFKTLAAKPEFQAYAPQVENYSTSVLSYGLDKSAKAIIDEAVINLTFDEGAQALTNLQEKFGINMASYKGDLYFKQLTIPTRLETLEKTAEAQAQLKGTTVEEERQKLALPPTEKEKIIEPITSPVSPTSALTTTPSSTTTPAPTTPTTSTNEYPYQTWERLTGLPWGEAKKYGSTGTAASNLALQQKLLSGWRPTTPTTKPTTPAAPTALAPARVSALSSAPASAPSSAPAKPAPAKPAPSGYTGVSMVDYLKSIGQASNFASRAKLAQQKGITNYTGTAEQNTRLLKLLRGF